MNMAESQTEKFYDNDAEKYDRRWSTPGGAITAKIQAQTVKELSKGWQDKHILEIGCGTGRFTLPLADLTNHLSVVDLSAEMLAITKRKLLAKKELQLEAKNSSVYELPFSPGSFDCAISINVFNHLEDIVRALQEVSRVLISNGQFLVNFANSQSYFALAAARINKMKHSVSSDVYSVWLTRKQIYANLESAGFKVIRVIGNVYVPFYLDYPLARNVLAALDSISRNSRLKIWAPSLFFLCEKNSV